MGRRINTEEFIKRAKKIHGNKYDYSKVEYTTYMNKVCIICPIHGEFWQTPNNHLNGTKPKGCPLCNHRSFALTTEEFIEKASVLHNNRYDYSKVEYKRGSEKVCIICPIHGEFWQTPNNHLNGFRCVQCANEMNGIRQRKSLLDFIKDAVKIHSNKYDYSKVEYINARTKVCIVCPIHGEFWQTPHKHINAKHGCPLCHTPSLEKELISCFIENQINFIHQYKVDWLGLQSLDFYLPEYHIGIECQGAQHFRSIDFFGGDDEFYKICERDQRKKFLCHNNGVNLLYYTTVLKNPPKEIVSSKDELIKIIKKSNKC